MNFKHYTNNKRISKVKAEVAKEVNTIMNQLLGDKGDDFTLLDYHRTCSIPPREFLRILVELKYDVRAQRKFIKMSRVHERIEIEKEPEFFMADNFKFGYRKYLDENDRSKYVDVFITKEEKAEIIKYFLDNDIPLCVSVFNMAMREKFNGTLANKVVTKKLEKDKTQVLSDLQLNDFKTQLEAGITFENGEKRDFGILDYYQFFTVSPKVVVEQYDKYLTDSEKAKLTTLYKSYFAMFGTSHISQSKIFANRIKQPYHFILNPQYIENKFGEMVVDLAGVSPNDIYYTTEEERAFAFEYLVSHEMEQTEKIFTTVLRAYVENKLPEQLNEKQSTKKKQF